MSKNPIPELVSDSDFQKLDERNFIQENELRNYIMRREFKKLRETNRKEVALDLIQKQYPYLGIDTIHGIVNSKKQYKKGDIK